MSEKCEMSIICPFPKIQSFFTSSEAGKHLLIANKELLLAVKSMIEKQIEKIDNAAEAPKAEKVKIK